MKQNRCYCGISCGAITIGISAIFALLIGVLFFSGTLVNIIPLINAAFISAAAALVIGLAIAFIPGLKMSACESECLCHNMNYLAAGGAGAFFTALIARVVSIVVPIAAFSLSSLLQGILTALIAASIPLTILSIICTILCVLNQRCND